MDGLDGGPARRRERAPAPAVEAPRRSLPSRLVRKAVKCTLVAGAASIIGIGALVGGVDTGLIHPFGSGPTVTKVTQAPPAQVKLNTHALQNTSWANFQADGQPMVVTMAYGQVRVWGGFEKSNPNQGAIAFEDVATPPGHDPTVYLDTGGGPQPSAHGPITLVGFQGTTVLFRAGTSGAVRSYDLGAYEFMPSG